MGFFVCFSKVAKYGGMVGQETLQRGKPGKGECSIEVYQMYSSKLYGNYGFRILYTMKVIHNELKFWAWNTKRWKLISIGNLVPTLLVAALLSACFDKFQNNVTWLLYVPLQSATTGLVKFLGSHKYKWDWADNNSSWKMLLHHWGF